MQYTILLSLAWCWVVCQSFAQGSTEFKASLSGALQLPPNGSHAYGHATFTLTGATLIGDVWLPQQYWSFTPISAMIEGPANAGGRGETIALGAGLVYIPGYEGAGGGYTFSLGGTLTQAQLDQLWSNQLYVNMTSAAFPEGEIRGPILQVPEPDVARLCFLAVVLCIATRSLPLCQAIAGISCSPAMRRT